MNTTDLSFIYPRGELGVRSSMLAAHLESPVYSAAQIFDNPSKNTWPGDWEGRTILAQTLICRSTGKYPAHLDEIVSDLPKHFNSRGYLGEMLPDGLFDEQQMSGHSWLLRGLVEYYYFRRYEYIKDMIRNIVYNLYIPAKNYYDNYPVSPEQRAGGGGESGSITGIVNAWRISTDTGCAYIPLDGISAAYELSGDNEIKKLLDEMVKCFGKIDPLKIKSQTHATLTAVRGILRIYNISENKEYLNIAKNIFNLYINNGLTPNYENYNWFGRPEWTEPCAVIDSFIVAMQLYMFTSDTRYIDCAQRIYYNGICREQRPNGGFGCNSCVTDGIIRNHCYEAYWCCTMRGGEGLARVAQYGYLIDGNHIIVPYLSSSAADLAVNGEIVHIEQTTAYPYEGRAVFEITGVASYNKITLLIYKPGCGDYHIETLSPDKRHIEIKFVIPFVKDETKNGIMYLHGNMILGTNPDKDPDFTHIEYKGNGRYSAGDVALSPIGDLYTKGYEEALSDEKRILF